MAIRPRKKISISILLPFLVLIVFFSVLVWQKYRVSHNNSTVITQQPVDGSKSVTLFFAAEGNRLVRESREIEPCENEMSCLKNVLDELLNGPVGESAATVPEGSSVDSVYIEGNMATIEFNSTFAEAMQLGSANELLAVYSVVDTINTNFPQIQRVKINVNGNTGVKLGNIDLTMPIVPDYTQEYVVTHKP